MRLKENTIVYSAAVLTISNILLQALGFLYRIILSRFGGAGGLGVYRLVFSVYLVINAGCLAGVTTACSRLSAEFRATGYIGSVRKLVKIAFIVFVSFFIPCVIIMLGFRHEIADYMLGDTRTASAFVPMLICLALTGIENIFKSICIGLNKMRLSAISEVVEQLIRIAAVCMLLYHFSNGDYGRLAFLIFLGMALSECFSALFLSYCYRHDIYPSARHGKTYKNMDCLKRFGAIALPLSFTALCNNILGSANSILLPKCLKLSGMGEADALAALGVVSGMAAPLILLPIALIGSVMTALMPALSKAYARGQQKTLTHLTEKGLFTVGMIGVPSVFVIVPMAPLLAQLIFRQEIAHDYLFLLGISAGFMFYEITAGGVLNVTGYQKYHIVTAIGAETLQLVLMIVLCVQPAFGIYGYLYASVFSSFAGAAVNTWILCKIAKREFRFSRVFVLPSVCACVLFLWTRLFLRVFLSVANGYWLAVGLTILGSGMLYLILLKLFRVSIWSYLHNRIEPSSTCIAHIML